jgi:FKBP-type peptidyl-prolyl cis-trans isomerase
MAALAAERRRQRLIRRLIWLGVAVIGVGFVIVLVTRLSDDDGSDVASSVTTTTFVPTNTSAATVTGSAAGKPCIPVSDPLPAGAPEIPVEVGPPPAALVTKDLKVGEGPPVPAGATVTVNYIGASCSTGKIFDSSYSRNQPATFALSGVIKGWTDGIPGMNVGGQRLLGIPSDQAYGAQGRPPDIAPDEPLWFVVEVTEVKPA